MKVKNSNMINTLIFFLAGFVSLSFFFSSAAAAACMPVVYAFRHAEDLKTGTGLRPVGAEHADRYDEMLADFESDRNYCPVGFVYAMYNKKPDGSPGTENPFQTAEPLAFRACYIRALAQGVLKPDLACSGSPEFSGALPLMQLENGAKLYEYLGTTTAEQKAKNSATKDQLRAELLSNTSYWGLSSAVFWTSQGLPTVGTAIAEGANIPAKIEGNGDSGPPKNAVYVFEYSGGILNPPKSLTKYVQCFNINVDHPTGSPGGTKYYCRKGVPDPDSASIGNHGDLPEITDFPPLEGRICDTTGLPLVKENYYGPCQ